MSYEKSYLKGYAKAIAPEVNTKHKTKGWLQGFINAKTQFGKHLGCNKPSIFTGRCGNSMQQHKNCGRPFEQRQQGNFLVNSYEKLVSSLMNLLNNQNINNQDIINNQYNYNYYNTDNYYYNNNMFA